jgi:hypothetical protein
MFLSNWNMPALEKTQSWRALFLVGITLALVVVHLRMPEPCWQPLTYQIGHIDERCGLTRWEFSMAVQKAAQINGTGTFTREQGRLKGRLGHDLRVYQLFNS